MKCHSVIYFIFFTNPFIQILKIPRQQSKIFYIFKFFLRVFSLVAFPFELREIYSREYLNQIYFIKYKQICLYLFYEFAIKI